ncbi:MAG: hypothetical protein HUJ30_00925 [Gammaproteobacteria bacterium]|nr:hypothetical protein [Gammaproteobacteria bacterium]
MVDQSERHLSIILPGMLGPVEPTSLPLSTVHLKPLSLLLARSQAQALEHNTVDSLLFALFNYPPVEELPVAAVTMQALSAEERGAWYICADPVLLVPGQSHLMCMGAGEELQLSKAESQALIESLNEHFADRELEFRAINPHRWLIRSPKHYLLTTTSMAQVYGEAVERRLPTGKDSIFWHSIIAEAQMLLHGHEINQQRMNTNKPAINGIWLSGSGTVAELAAHNWSSVSGNMLLLQGMLAGSTITLSAVPDNMADWLKALPAGEHLIAVEHQIAAQNWTKVMASLASQWWAPMFDALKNGQLESVTLYPLNGTRYKITSSMSRRWWKSAKQIHHYLDSIDYEKAY